MEVGGFKPKPRPKAAIKTEEFVSSKDPRPKAERP